MFTDYGIFAVYEPDERIEGDPGDVIYFANERGEDFYQLFQPQPETIKCAFMLDADNRIISHSADVSGFAPMNNRIITADQLLTIDPEKDYLWDGEEIREIIRDYEPRRVGEFREFMNLFTTEEQIALKTAERDNIQVAIWFDLARGGAQLSLDHPHVAEGIAFMVSLGLLSDARGTEILATDFNVIN